MPDRKWSGQQSDHRTKLFSFVCCFSFDGVSADLESSHWRDLLPSPLHENQQLFVAGRISLVHPAKFQWTSRSGLWHPYRAGEAVRGEALKEATCGVGQVAG